MILKSLTLKNFRKFKSEVVDFPDGIVGVIGLNGVGKSTIFEAIAWAFYGPNAARTPIDEIKRKNADLSDPCRVEVDFIFGEDAYRVVREMTGKNLSASASVTLNGMLAATGADAVNEYIQSKLGMDFKSFFTSIFARQKELNALSVMNASERRALILRMLGIDTIDSIITEIRSDKRNKENLLEKINADLVDETGKNRIDKYHEEIHRIKQKKEEIQCLIERQKDMIMTHEKTIHALEKENDERKTDYEKLLLLKEKLDDKKKLVEKKHKLSEEMKILETKLEERQKVVITHQEQIKKFDNLDYELQKIEQKFTDVDGRFDKAIRTIEQKKTLLERTQKDIKEVQVKRKNIEKMGPSAPCPTCERILGEQHDTLLKKFDTEIISKHTEIKSLNDEITAAKTTYDQINREKQALQKRKTYVQAQHIEQEKIRTRMQTILEEIKKEKKELENKQGQLQDLGVIEFDERAYTTTKTRVEATYKAYQALLAVLVDKRKELEKIKLERERNEGEKRLVVQQIEHLHQKLKEQEELHKRIRTEKTELQKLNMLNEIMASFRIHLISRIRPTLSLYASDLFQQLTDGKYGDIEIDENYNLLVYDEGTSYGIKRFSGGEEDLANLCLRLAISEVITERAGSVFNVIILDEIFGSQDMIRRQNIIRALNSLSSKFRQIFLITHIDDIKNFMEHTITVQEDESNISRIKIE